MARKEFSIQSILKRLVDTPAKCKKCGKTALQGKLNLHHKEGNSCTISFFLMISS